MQDERVTVVLVGGPLDGLEMSRPKEPTEMTLTEMTLIEPDYRGQRNVYKLETELAQICKGTERIVYRFAHTQRQK